MFRFICSSVYCWLKNDQIVLFRVQKVRYLYFISLLTSSSIPRPFRLTSIRVHCICKKMANIRNKLTTKRNSSWIYSILGKKVPCFVCTCIDQYESITNKQIAIANTIDLQRSSSSAFLFFLLSVYLSLIMCVCVCLYGVTLTEYKYTLYECECLQYN